MILGSLISYESRQHTQPVNSFGKFVAHEQLIKYLLLNEVVSGVDVFAPTLLPRLFQQYHHEFDRAIGEHFGSTGPRPVFKALGELPTALRSANYCFLSSGFESHRLGQLRYTPGLKPFFIATLVHAVHWLELLPFYCGLAVTSNASDVIITTSTAAARAFKHVMEWVTAVSDKVCQAEIVTIPLGIDTESFPCSDRATARSVLRIPQEAHLLLYVGRLSE